MYDALEAMIDEMKNLEQTLAGGHAGMRIGAIAAAFEDCAQRVSDATAACADADERAALQKIYRGMIAGQRLVHRLNELAADDSTVSH
ncbi:type III secretion protein [Burkholderia cepacia]|uniref:Type III secretion protein n=1 Tax=Burkholderia cepacia TaxID=292 RepID=A0A2S8IV86_BURCE|nr:type III secretion protein [Burkholderia cepacia]PQP18680.1 type III secretion protein [Burkholderia cepacia]HDR9505649.1 type III secretion system protein [Burkholderia cepacia]